MGSYGDGSRGNHPHWVGWKVTQGVTLSLSPTPDLLGAACLPAWRLWCLGLVQLVRLLSLLSASQRVSRVLLVKHHSYAALPSSRTTSGSLWLIPLHPNAFLWLPIPIIISMSVSVFLITGWDCKHNTWAWTWPNNPIVQKYIQWILTWTQTLKYPSFPSKGHQKCAIHRMYVHAFYYKNKTLYTLLFIALLLITYLWYFSCSP